MCIRDRWKTLELTEKYPHVYAAVGIHPEHAGELREEDMEWLRGLLAGARVVAVSYTHLDVYKRQVLACISLILVIHNAFAVFMNDRVQQFGILSSVGATPAQIRACLLQEAGMLCALPVLMGNLLGMATAAGLLEAINEYVREAALDRLESHFVFHPLVLAGSILCAVATVWISAWLHARRLSRMTPLEAIRGAEDVYKRQGVYIFGKIGFNFVDFLSLHYAQAGNAVRNAALIQLFQTAHLIL